MRYKANISFAGSISMNKGDIKELSEKAASDLLRCGYIFAVESEGEDGEIKRDNSKPSKTGRKN